MCGITARLGGVQEVMRLGDLSGLLGYPRIMGGVANTEQQRTSKPDFTSIKVVGLFLKMCHLISGLNGPLIRIWAVNMGVCTAMLGPAIVIGGFLPGKVLKAGSF